MQQASASPKVLASVSVLSISAMYKSVLLKIPRSSTFARSKIPLRCYSRLSIGQPVRIGQAALVVLLGATGLALCTTTIRMDSLHPAEAAQVPVPKDGEGLSLVAASEVKKHNTKDSCWVVLDNEVWESVLANHAMRY